MPVAAPDATGFEDVTNGYVPWSRSSSVLLRAFEEHVLPPALSARSGRRSDVSGDVGAQALCVRLVLRGDVGRARTSRPRTHTRARRSSPQERPRSWARRIFGSSTSCTPPIPILDALSAYAGPIPRRVVPIWERAQPALGTHGSIAMCHGMIRCALPEKKGRRRQRQRSPKRVELSDRAPSGSTTQPAAEDCDLPREDHRSGIWRSL